MSSFNRATVGNLDQKVSLSAAGRGKEGLGDEIVLKYSVN